MTGRGFGNLTKGDRITAISQMPVGAVVLEHSVQFEAENTARITQGWSDKVYGRFVNPLNPSENWGAEFCIWDFYLTAQHPHSEYWLAVFPEPIRVPDAGVADLPLFQAA